MNVRTISYSNTFKMTAAILLLSILEFSCVKNEHSNQKETSATDLATDQEKNQENPGTSASGKAKSDSAVVKGINDELLQLLKEEKYSDFADLIHSEKGVRFSMYGYINPSKDKTFSSEEFRKYVGTRVKFTWGERDGSGDPLVMTIEDYLKKWVYKRDFIKGEFAYNRYLQTGNSLNNIHDVYPLTVFSENYIAGSAKYNEMDWNCLRFVFEKKDGKFLLVAVVNDEWTI